MIDRRSTPRPADTKPAVIECKAGEYYWCACGFSSHQPFCDGTHREESELHSHKFTLDEDKTVALCMCKHTKNKPFCDGSHNHVDAE